jgi:hypothetical protein
MKHSISLLVALALSFGVNAQVTVDAARGQVSGNKFFSPGEAKYLPFKLGTANVTVVDDGRRLYLQIQRPSAGDLRIELPPESGQVSRVYRYKDQLVVLSWLDGMGSTGVTVFDASNGTQVDHFWAYGVVPSPNGRYLALRRWVQARGAEAMDSQYRLYDLERTPNHNRRGEEPQSGADDVGQILYPLSPGEVAREPGLAHIGNAHNALTNLTWSVDSRHVAVLDQHEGMGALVVAEVQDDRRPQVRVGRLPELGRLCTDADAGRACVILPFNDASLAVDRSLVRVTAPQARSRSLRHIDIPISRLTVLPD